jgi:hypothetical protein
MCVTNPDRPQNKRKEEPESESGNKDLEKEDGAINCLTTERAKCNGCNILEEKAEAEYDVVYQHYVNEKNLGTSPQVTFSIGLYQLSAVLDTGCEASILSM